MIELELISFEKRKINGRYLAVYTNTSSLDFIIQFEKYFDDKVPPMKANLDYLINKK